MRRRRLRASLLLIASDERTLRGIRQYFERVDARCVSLPTLGEASGVEDGLDAAVIFADDFSEEAVAGAANDLPVKLVIIVTRDVEAQREALWPKRARARVLVLPRLAWGFTLVEVVRRSLPLNQATV